MQGLSFLHPYLVFILLWVCCVSTTVLWLTELVHNFLHMYACIMSVFLNIYVHIYLWVYLAVRPKVDICCLLSSLSTLFFEARYLSLTQSSVINRSS